MGRRIGIYLVGLALAFIILSLLGAGPWDSVAVGLNNYLGFTIGTWSIISQLIFTLLTWMIEKNRFRLETVIPIVIRSWFLDFWIYVVFKNADFSISWEAQWFSLIIGVILVGVGIGLYVEAELPKTPIDGLMMAISNRFAWSLNITRIYIEVSGVIMGFLLGGPVGFGTLVVALFLGKIIQTSNHRIKKILQVQTKPLEIP